MQSVFATILFVVGVYSTSMQGLHVIDNKIVNSQGETVILRGVNRSGPEYACVGGWGFFDGPSGMKTVQQ
jgi:hypothetical protein